MLNLESRLSEIPFKRIFIAGAGGMGEVIAHLNLASGRDVALYDPDKDKATALVEKLRQQYGVQAAYLPREEGITWADLVWIATSIRATDTFLTENRNYLASKAVVTIRSVQNGTGELLREICPDSLMTHPMYGSAVRMVGGKLRGQNHIIMPTGDLNNAGYEPRYEFLKKYVRSFGPRVVEMSSGKEHDIATSLVLGQYHAFHQINAMFDQLSGLGRQLHDNPLSRQFIVGRSADESVVNSDPSLYWVIQHDNEYALPRIDSFISVLEEGMRALPIAGIFNLRLNRAKKFYANGRANFAESFSREHAAAQAAIVELEPQKLNGYSPVLENRILAFNSVKKFAYACMAIAVSESGISYTTHLNLEGTTARLSRVQAQKILSEYSFSKEELKNSEFMPALLRYVLLARLHRDRLTRNLEKDFSGSLIFARSQYQGSQPYGQYVANAANQFSLANDAVARIPGGLVLSGK